MKLIFGILCLWSLAWGQPTLVLTFDNLPIHNTLLMDCETRTQKFIDALAQADIQTVFFTIGVEVAKSNQRRLDAIARLVQRGHLIANHSYSHPHLSAVSVDQYLADVMKCETLITPLATYRPWFRYPFLDIGLDPMEGASVEKAVECAHALKQLGFRHAYVSIDSFDWYINMLMLQALLDGRKFEWDDLEAFYLNHLKKTIDRYLRLKSDKEKGLFTTQVFLFHANDLNALFLPKMIAMLRAEGWHIGKPDEIFDNPDNQLTDFDTFIDLKLWELSSDAYGHFQDPAAITREFNEQVLHLSYFR